MRYSSLSEPNSFAQSESEASRGAGEKLARCEEFVTLFAERDSSIESFAASG
jgi:hypothetical protein